MQLVIFSIFLYYLYMFVWWCNFWYKYFYTYIRIVFLWSLIEMLIDFYLVLNLLDQLRILNISLIRGQYMYDMTVFFWCACFTFIHEPAVVLQYMLKKWESNWTSASLREMFFFAGCFAKSVLSGKKLQICDFIANERAKTCFVHMFTSHKWQKAE